MIRSMTGFGRAVLELPHRKVSIEIRALNSKQLDLNLKLPQLYREKESDIRNHLSARLERGKVDCYINVENSGASQVGLNEKLALEYVEVFKKLAQKMGQVQEPDYFSLVMRMPEVMNTESAGLEEEEWTAVEKSVIRAITELDSFRDQEGELLSKELANRVDKINALLESVNPLEARRMELKREKLQKWVDDFSDKAVFDQNRFEQEMIFYLEKMDFTEEKVRLKQHCEYFKTTMQEKEGNGRKLNFITQEMGREINTLGAKANDADIQKIVVQMKDELEKVKEQLANVL